MYHDGLANENSRIALYNDPVFTNLGYYPVLAGEYSVSADNDCFGLLHANIARYFYFLVTKGNLTLLFFTRE